jgi:glycosyltransferase involved in cell wall biosynthesis
VKWVIISDGSTDGTDTIVEKYMDRHSWIELVRMPRRGMRHFAGKVDAFNEGYEKVKHLDYDIIANLDADISFDADYFSFLLKKFSEDPLLGVAGTPFREGRYQYDYRYTSIEHVSGQCQVFRRECFESIGGYIPRELGGIDLVAVIMARMRGWRTRTFPEQFFVHHRKMGTAKGSSLKARFVDGQKDYLLGTHPLWEICRTLYQMTKSPVFLGGFVLVSGYLLSVIRNTERSIPMEVMQFRQKEQMERLRNFFLNKLAMK